MLLHQILGTEFKSHFILAYCNEVPRDQVPPALLARYPAAKEVFYRVKQSPPYCLINEPVRIIPGYLKPADPARNLSEKWIPERKIGPFHESLRAMTTNQVFADSQL